MRRRTKSASAFIFMVSWRRGKTTAERGYGSAWQRAREQFLRKHPLCVMCMERCELTPATVVDHIEPHRGDSKKFWDQSNWQALCKHCHDSLKKTIEHGGRPPASFDENGRIKW